MTAAKWLSSKNHVGLDRRSFSRPIRHVSKAVDLISDLYGSFRRPSYIFTVTTLFIYFFIYYPQRHEGITAGGLQAKKERMKNTADIIRNKRRQSLNWNMAL